MHSSALVIVVECPSPVVSSSISTLPAGKRRDVPSVLVTSYSPRTVMKIARRGAGCFSPPFQSMGAPIQKAAVRRHKLSEVERVCRWHGEADAQLDVDISKARGAELIRVKACVLRAHFVPA